MVQIRQRNSRNGITYVYEADRYWDKDKKQTRYRNRRMIGQVDPETSEVIANRTSVARREASTSCRLFVGATYLLDQLADQSGLRKDWETVLGERLPVILEFVKFITAEYPAPSSRYPKWIQTHAGLDSDQSEIFSRLSKALSSVTLTEVEDVFQASLKRESGQYWLFDMTPITSYSTLLERVRWGYGKDGTPKIRNLQAAKKAEDTSTLLRVQSSLGDINDITLAKHLLALKSVNAGVTKIVMDPSFYSHANIDSMIASPMQFLIEIKTSIPHVQEALDANLVALHSRQHYNPVHQMYGMRINHEWPFASSSRTKSNSSKANTYLHLFFAQERGVFEEREFARLLDRLNTDLVLGDTREENQSHYDKYFQCVNGRWIGRDAEINAERARQGHFVLLSDDATLDCWEAYQMCRVRSMVLAGLHRTLIPQTIETSPFTHQPLPGRFMAMLMTFGFLYELQRRMAASGLDTEYTVSTLLDEFDVIEQYHQPGHQPRLLNLTEKQISLYNRLGVVPPV